MKDELISVIVSTYNRPDALLASLSGLNRQTDGRFEVVIADDGSGEETRRTIEEFRSRAVFPLLHVWHPDQGFRLSAVRNLAIRSCSGAYLLFLDGDCIPADDWVLRNRRLAERGWSVIGQRILLSEGFTRDLLADPAQAPGSLAVSRGELRKMVGAGKINRTAPTLRLPLGPLRKLAARSWDAVRGCNWGIWMDDMRAVNGWEESIVGWGGEDNDMAVRLLNVGVRLKSGRFASAVFHLWHPHQTNDSSMANLRYARVRLARGQIRPKQGLEP